MQHSSHQIWPYRRVNPWYHTSGHDETTIPILRVWLFPEIMHCKFPRIHCAYQIDVDNVEFRLHRRQIRVCVELVSIWSPSKILEDSHNYPMILPSNSHRSSPEARLIPALAMTMSQLLWGEFLIAASNIATWSSQEVILHFTNWALLILELVRKARNTFFWGRKTNGLNSSAIFFPLSSLKSAIVTYALHSYY